MKEATGELNMTVVTIVAIAAIAAFLTLMWNSKIKGAIENQWDQAANNSYNTNLKN